MNRCCQFMDNTIIKILSSLFWEVFFYSLMGLQYVCLQHVISKHDLSNYWRAYKTKDVSRILVRDKTNLQPFSSTFDSLTEYSATLIQVDGSEKLKISKIWSFPLNFIDWKHFMRKPEYTDGLKDEHNAFLLQRSKDLYIIWPYDGQAGKTKTRGVHRKLSDVCSPSREVVMQCCPSSRYETRKVNFRGARARGNSFPWYLNDNFFPNVEIIFKQDTLSLA